MGQITVTPNTYAGERLDEIIAQTVLRGETLERGLVTVHTNIDKRLIVPTFSKSLIIKDSGASFSANADGTTLGEVYLDPKAFMINEEYDASNLNATWYASQQPRGRTGDFELPDNINDAIVEQNGALNGSFIDASIWHGTVYAGGLSDVTNSATNVVTGLFDKAEASGSVKKLSPQVGVDKLVVTGISKAGDGVFTVASTANLQDGDIITLVGAAGSASWVAFNGEHSITVASATTLTVGVDTSSFTGTYTASSGSACFVNSSNAIAVMTRVYRAINKIMKKDPAFMLFTDSLFADAYRFAQAEVANGAGSYYIGEKEMDFLGRKIIELPFIKSNFLMGAKSTNLHFGTALTGEWNNAAILDMSATTLDYVSRYRVDYAFDTQITSDKDMLVYRPA